MLKAFRYNPIMECFKEVIADKSGVSMFSSDQKTYVSQRVYMYNGHKRNFIMKQLDKTMLRGVEVLGQHAMRNVRGGNKKKQDGGYGFCIGPGDVTAGPFSNCSNEFCEKTYGTGSHCG